MSKVDYKLYCDNAGGITLETSDNYMHYYNDMYQLANDITELQNGETTETWDGNEVDEIRDNAPDWCDAAEMKILDQDDVNDLINHYDDDDYINLGSSLCQLIKLLSN